MVLLLCNISVPPNHNTMTMSIVPRNSLIGCAICWRMLTWLMVLRYRLLDSVLGKYEKIFGRPFDGDTGFSWSLLSEPKRKGIFMMRFTTEESKVIGYMYKFKLSMSPILHQIMYETGIGEKVNLGFGCVEILRQDTTPNDQNFLSDEKDNTSVKII